MAFGVTAQGFKAKRLADILDETEIAWRDKFGEGFDLDPRTPEGQIKGILDEALSKIWELGEGVSRSYVPKYSEGVTLQNVLSLSGITLKGAVASVVEEGRGRGVFGTVIAVGTIISVTGNTAAKFVTQATETISIAAINEVQKLTFSATPVSGGFKIIFDGEITAVVNWNDTAPAVQAAMEALSNIGLGNIAVSGSISNPTGLTFTYQGALAGANQPEISITQNTLNGGITVTPSTLTAGDKAKTPLMRLVAQDTGPIAAPTGSLSVIETPVSGLQEFTNEADAILGRDIESDDAAKLRREEELQFAGSATPEAIRADLLQIEDVTAVVIFRNVLSVYDIDGRPPHSIDIVIEGSDEDTLAQAIFDTVADGIETIGDISKTVIDSQGFGNTVKFSRPTPKDIWVEVDITKDPALFPADGDVLVAQKILAYGNTLTVGQDVVVFGSDPALSCAFDDVPGMLDLVFRVGTAASPTLDNNVIIAPRERALFDSARIEVNIL